MLKFSLIFTRYCIYLLCFLISKSHQNEMKEVIRGTDVELPCVSDLERANQIEDYSWKIGNGSPIKETEITLFPKFAKGKIKGSLVLKGYDFENEIIILCEATIGGETKTEMQYQIKMIEKKDEGKNSGQDKQSLHLGVVGIVSLLFSLVSL